MAHEASVSGCAKCGVCAPMLKRGGKRVRRRCSEEDESIDTDGNVQTDGSRIFFYADVTRATVLQLVRALRAASAHAVEHAQGLEQPRVFLHLHSDGGDAFAGLSAMDHIRTNRVPVTTVADGMVASAASFMLLGASFRLAHRHAFVRIHQLSIRGFEGKYADLMDEMQNTHTLMAKVRRVYLDNTLMSEMRVEEVLKKELDMDAEQCQAAGIVHAILGNES